MMETNSSQPDFHRPESGSGEGAASIRDRAARLQEKVADLSKAIDRIEETLAEAGDGNNDSSD